MMTIEEKIQEALKKIEPMLKEFYFLGIEKGWEIGMADNNENDKHATGNNGSLVDNGSR